MNFPFFRMGVSIWIFFHASNILFSQTTVSIDFQTQRFIGTHSTLDRSKFINIHSDFTSNDYDNVSELRYLLDSLGVGFGRNVGATRWIMSQLQNDPDNTDFPDPGMLNSNGTQSITSFENTSSLHPFNTDQMVYTSHITPLFPNSVTAANPPSGYVPITYSGSASFLKQFFGQYFAADSTSPGKLRPAYFEVMNEPFVHRWEYNTTVSAMSEFHNVVADTLHLAYPEMKIGGHTAAWPEYERNDFDIWETTMKEFLDISGSRMDFISVHFYDVPADTTERGSIRAGSNVEACLDLIETYTAQKFGQEKPFMISEYGACCGGLGWDGPYSAYRDWRILKSTNALLMTFLKRQNRIEKTIPFIVGKAKWWLNNNPDPYPHVIYHRNGSLWQFTHLIKWYQFWQGVEGERVEVSTGDPDIQLEAFVRGQKAYVFVNNYEFNSHTIDIQLPGMSPSDVAELKARRLYLDESTQAPVLTVSTLDPAQSQLELKAEESVMLEYTFSSALSFSDTVYEDRYFAQENLLPIQSGQAVQFSFKNLPTPATGHAVLRFSVGRAHGRSLAPQLTVNGNSVDVPSDWFGYDQLTRDDFFGMIEVPVPLNLLSTSTTISLVFPDGGGHVASAVFALSSSEYILTNNDSHIEEKDWRVFPNPAYDKVQLELPVTLTGTLSLRLYDINGKEVFRWTPMRVSPSETIELGFGDIPAGLYLLHAQTDEWQGDKKLFIH